MRHISFVTIALLSLVSSINAMGQQPLIQTNFTADPAPMVDNDSIYLYTSHDEDYAEGFQMHNWLLHTSTDMVNWTNCGQVADLGCFSSWFHADNGAWALQVIRRGDKYYMYCPLQGWGIGVLVSDSPYGPFTDPIGKPIVNNGWECIDPTVFVDDDGQAYLYWGNPELWMVKLNDDMVSYSGDIVQFPRITDYQEGPWIYKRNGKYYMAFASTCCPEGIGYAMSDSPMGPWEYKGHIMNHYPESSGNHPGIIDYRGKTYAFGFSNELLREMFRREGKPYVHSERRSVHAAEIEFWSDGTIIELPFWTNTTLRQLENLNPYRRVEAETMAWGFGLKIERDGDVLCNAANHRDIFVTDIDDGESLTVRGVDFGDGAGALRMRVASAYKGGVVEVRLDSETGPLVGTLNIGYTGEELVWKDEVCAISGASGVHDLVYVFRGDDPVAASPVPNVPKQPLFCLDWWEFIPKTDKQLIGINAFTPDYRIDCRAYDGVEVPTSVDLVVKAVYSDGTEVKVSDYTVEYNSDAIAVADGRISGLSYGNAAVRIAYGGFSDEVKVIVADFEAELTLDNISVDPEEIVVLLGDKTPYAVSAQFRDGNVYDITSEVKPKLGVARMATFDNGVVTGKKRGETTATFTWQGKMGDACSVDVPLKVCYRNPYATIEAENYSEANRTTLENGNSSSGGVHVACIDNGSWLMYKSVDFGTAGADKFIAMVSTQTSGGNIEVRLDSPTGQLVATAVVTNRYNSWTRMHEVTAPVSGATGVHDLYLVFTGGSGWLFNLDSFLFAEVNGVTDIINDTTSDGTVYDLDGRSFGSDISSLTPGIYIRSGKKMVVK